MDAAAVIDLLASLGRTVPALPRALCRNHLDVFDREDPDGIAEAITLCGRCLERKPCARWAATMNPNRLTGVVAGHRYVHRYK